MVRCWCSLFPPGFPAAALPSRCLPPSSLDLQATLVEQQRTCAEIQSRYLHRCQRVTSSAITELAITVITPTPDTAIGTSSTAVPQPGADLDDIRQAEHLHRSGSIVRTAVAKQSGTVQAPAAHRCTTGNGATKVPTQRQLSRPEKRRLVANLYRTGLSPAGLLTQFHARFPCRRFQATRFSWRTKTRPRDSDNGLTACRHLGRLPARPPEVIVHLLA